MVRAGRVSGTLLYAWVDGGEHWFGWKDDEHDVRTRQDDLLSVAEAWEAKVAQLARHGDQNPVP